MKIYIASKTKHAHQWKDLRRSGVSITSTWIDEAGPGDSPDLADLAMRCVREAAEADRLILYAEPEDILKGALVEVGAALAADVEVIIVGECSSLATALIKHRLVRRADSIAMALEMPTLRSLAWR